MFEVILSRRAERDLAGLDTAYRNAFLRKFLELRHWPDHHADIRPLRGSLKGTFRMRIGPYRAILASMRMLSA